MELGIFLAISYDGQREVVGKALLRCNHISSITPYLFPKFRHVVHRISLGKVVKRNKHSFNIIEERSIVAIHGSSISPRLYEPYNKFTLTLLAVDSHLDIVVHVLNIRIGQYLLLHLGREVYVMVQDAEAYKVVHTATEVRIGTGKAVEHLVEQQRLQAHVAHPLCPLVCVFLITVHDILQHVTTQVYNRTVGVAAGAALLAHGSLYQGNVCGERQSAPYPCQMFLSRVNSLLQYVLLVLRKFLHLLFGVSLELVESGVRLPHTPFQVVTAQAGIIVRTAVNQLPSFVQRSTMETNLASLCHSTHTTSKHHAE